MKRAKLLRLIEQVRAEARLESHQPLTFDNITVDFVARTVTFRGRTITVPEEHRAFVAPLLSTDQLILPRDGSVVL